MTVAAIASIIDGIVIKTFRNLKQSFLIKKECPEVILQVERGFRVLILLILCPALFEEVPIPLRLHVPCFHVSLIFRCRTIATKCEDVGLVLHDDINEFWYLIDVSCRDGGHDGAMHTTLSDSSNCFQRAVIRTWLAETVMCLSQSIERQLVLTAAKCLHPRTDLISQVEGVAHDGEGDAVRVDEFEEIPEAAVQDRVTARDI